MTYSLDYPKQSRLRRAANWFLSRFLGQPDAKLRREMAELTAQNAHLRQQLDAGLRVERMLKEERNLVRTLINNFPDLIYVKDTEGAYKLVNRALVRHTGNTDFADVINKTDYDFFPADIAESYQIDDRLVIETADVLASKEQINQNREGGQQGWYITTKAPLLDADGQVKGIVGISRDISAYKETELALQQAHGELEARVAQRTAELSQAYLNLQTEILERQKAEERLRYQASLLEHISNAVISTDRDFNIQSWNTAAEEIYGWTADEVIGRSIQEVTQATFPGSSQDEVREMLLQAGHWKGEIWNRRKDHSVVPIFAVVSLIYDEDGNRIGSVIINHNLSPLRAAEHAEQEQRLLAKALGDMAAAINSTLNLNDVLDRLLDHVARVIPYDSANIMLIEGDTARVVRGRGYEEQGLPMSQVYQMRFPLKDFPIFMKMFDTEHPILVTNTHTYPDWRFSGEPIAWMRSYVGAPIYIEGHIIGFLNIDSVHYDGFTAVQADYLHAFANQAAIAIRNARLYEKISRHAGEMEQRVAERTAELERQGAQLVTILDSMTEGVVGIMFDEHGQTALRYINQAFADMTGYIAEEWGVDLSQLSQVTPSAEDAQQLIHAYAEAMSGLGYWQGEVQLRRKDGSLLDAVIGINRVTDLDENPIGLVTVIRDIVQHQTLEAQCSHVAARRPDDV